jgi:hypothetical protein
LVNRLIKAEHSWSNHFPKAHLWTLLALETKTSTYEQKFLRGHFIFNYLSDYFENLLGSFNCTKYTWHKQTFRILAIFLVYGSGINHIHIDVKWSPICKASQTKILTHLSLTLHFPFSQTLEISISISFSMNVTTLGTSCKWTHIVNVLSCHWKL